jgi:hypothetical protein
MEQFLGLCYVHVTMRIPPSVLSADPGRLDAGRQPTGMPMLFGGSCSTGFMGFETSHILSTSLSFLKGERAVFYRGMWSVGPIAGSWQGPFVCHEISSKLLFLGVPRERTSETYNCNLALLLHAPERSDRQQSLPWLKKVHGVS